MAEKGKRGDCNAEPGDVKCDFCTAVKRKASQSCLVCLASYCKTHIKSHYQSPAFKKHKLVKASARLQEKICSQHDKLMEFYCRADQSCICYMCMMEEHKGHDTVEASAARTEKQSELIKVQRRSQQRLQKKEKKLQELKQTVDDLKSSAQAAVEDSERIFGELIHSLEKKCSEVVKQIRTQEKNQLSQTEGLLKQLEQEVEDLKTKYDELEQLSNSEDHIHFLQTLQYLPASTGGEDSANITSHQQLSFDAVRNSLSALKERLEEFCKEELCKIKLPNLYRCKAEYPEPEPSRKRVKSGHSKIDFQQMTLNPDTMHHKLALSEENRMVTWRGGAKFYTDHPDRFNHWPQVLSVECVSGRSYWEVDWDNGGWGVSISVSYKEISRKGKGDECAFGGNNMSWSLLCSSVLSFWHNNVETKLSGPSSSRIGVYVDHSAGTLSFYSVSDTMTLLHTVHTTFTQPLYCGFWVKMGNLKLCAPGNTSVVCRM
ncbi:hypothetical protein NFI96_030945 [Prochilodus magdalenae]|nr:hypothetical protein NFI96_030945 [Prochilodus magdalenae]